MKVYIIEEHYFCEGDEVITPIKVFQFKVDAEKFVEEHKDEYQTCYDIYEFEVE